MSQNSPNPTTTKTTSHKLNKEVFLAKMLNLGWNYTSFGWLVPTGKSRIAAEQDFVTCIEESIECPHEILGYELKTPQIVGPGGEPKWDSITKLDTPVKTTETRKPKG